MASWWRSLKEIARGTLSIPIFVAKWGGMIGPGQEPGIQEPGAMACSRRSTSRKRLRVVRANLRRRALLQERLHAIQELQLGHGFPRGRATPTNAVTNSGTIQPVDCCVYDANHQQLFDTAAMLLLFVTLGKFPEEVGQA